MGVLHPFDVVDRKHVRDQTFPEIRIEDGASGGREMLQAVCCEEADAFFGNLIATVNRHIH